MLRILIISTIKQEPLPKNFWFNASDCTVVFERMSAEHPEAHIIHVALSAVTTVSYNSCVICKAPSGEKKKKKKKNFRKKKKQSPQNYWVDSK